MPGAPAVTAQLFLTPEAVSRKDSSRYVRFGQIRIGLRLPEALRNPKASEIQWGFTGVNLGTAGDFKEGQKSVLGKVSGTGDQSAIFVVISLRVLD
jgi:hypothetical protein